MKKIGIDIKLLIIAFCFAVIGKVFFKEHQKFFWIIAFILGGFSKTLIGLKATIKEKSLNVEFLMILSALGALLINHYEEGAILILIFAFSGILEEYSMNKSEKEIQKLLSIMPKFATKLVKDKTVIVAVDDLLVGDIILVKVGEQIPSEGIVFKNTTLVNESMVTGEARLIRKNEKDKVLSGSINEESAIYVKLTTLAKDSVVQRIIDYVKNAKLENTKIQLSIKKIEKYYVYAVLVLAAVLLFILLLLGLDFKESIYRSIMLLVVASPCALVASVTPVMLSSISNAAKKKILIKGSNPIQELSEIKTVFLDKTGTLTYGRPKVVEVISFTDEIAKFYPYIYTMEKSSSHPLANAIVEYLKEYDLVSDMQTEEIKGRGVKSIYKNHKYFIGLNDDLDSCETTYTTVYFMVDEKPVCKFFLEDEIRKEAKETILELKKLHIKTVIITGDSKYNAISVQKKLGIDEVYYRCMPNDKLDIVKEERKKNKVVMIGDGINDALAFVSANVSVSMKGADVAMESADVIFMNDKIENIVYLLKLAKKAKKIYLQNIFFSLFVITILIISNLLFLIDLPLGVVFHEGSTILVILNGLRMLRKL